MSRRVAAEAELWVSAVPGSTTAVSEILMSEPSATVVGALNAAVGATLLTSTSIVSVSVPPSSSATVALTVAVPAPESSEVVQLKLPLLEAGVKTTRRPSRSCRS